MSDVDTSTAAPAASPQLPGDLPVVIVLAAGRGERFKASGGATHKLDALLDGKRVLDHVVDAVMAAGLRLHAVTADASRPGMGDSIAAGVAATLEATGWLVLPGSMRRPDCSSACDA